MPDLPDIFTRLDANNDTPLPLIVAKRWNFPLAHVRTADGIFYAIQDWLKGLTGLDDVRRVLPKLRNKHPSIIEAMRTFPYKSTNGKTYRIPYIDEQGLMTILVNLRLSTGRLRLVDVRNFIAQLLPEYAYLNCPPVADRKLSEYEFQSSLVTAIKSIAGKFEIKEYYPTPSGRRADIAMISLEDSNANALQILIECKVDGDEFYKAIGQLICYKTEIAQAWGDISRILLFIAIPHECINDYMRNIARGSDLSLISVVDGKLIDAIRGESVYAFDNLVSMTQ